VKTKGKKIKSPKERLLKALARHFGKMPAKEAKKQIEKLNRAVTADRASDRAKQQRPSGTLLNGFLNRSQ
jgi:hypothetical protein